MLLNQSVLFQSVRALLTKLRNLIQRSKKLILFLNKISSLIKYNQSKIRNNRTIILLSAIILFFFSCDLFCIVPSLFYPLQYSDMTSVILPNWIRDLWYGITSLEIQHMTKHSGQACTLNYDSDRIINYSLFL